MSIKNLFKGLLAGLAIGGILGILLAPKSGKQVRQDLKKAYRATSKDIARRINEIEDISQSKYEQVVEAVINEYKKLDPMTQEQIESLKSTLQNKWSEIVDKKSI
ncbi:YtxH domain-containing protein [bacterium]|nr:YtxH domain-containing protein [Candidatus Elulimicrobium humile]